MPLTNVIPPEKYDPIYCDTVHQYNNSKMDEIKQSVDDVHGAVFGSKEQPGLMQLLTRKVSTASVRFYVGVFAIPVLVLLFAAYQFYVAAPLTYSTKSEVSLIDDRVISVEERVKALPTGLQMKEIVKEAIKESKVP